MTAGQVARIYLGQSGERAANTAGSAWQVALALYDLQQEIADGLGWRRQKGNKHGWTTYKFKVLDWLYISLHVQKPKVFTTALAVVPLGCVILKRAGEAGLDVIYDRRLTWSKRRRGTRRSSSCDGVCILRDRALCLQAMVAGSVHMYLAFAKLRRQHVAA
jgi:hypothetical protein